jgi:hypothetical protein
VSANSYTTSRDLTGQGDYAVGDVDCKMCRRAIARIEAQACEWEVRRGYLLELERLAGNDRADALRPAVFKGVYGKQLLAVYLEARSTYRSR